MENKVIRETIMVLTNSLYETQCNSINTEKTVQQVLSLSDHVMHEKTIAGLIADDKTDWTKKVELLKGIYSDYDKRIESNTERVIHMQSSQTQNIGSATSWWAKSFGRFVIPGLSLLVLFITPGGRKLLTSGAKILVAAT